MSWREIQLGEAIHVKHGFAFKGEYFSDIGSYVVLTPGNFNEEGSGIPSFFINRIINGLQATSPSEFRRF